MPRKRPLTAKYDTSHISVDAKGGFSSANWISRIWFFWMEPLFIKGLLKKVSLDQSDLHPSPRYTDSERVQDAFQRYWRQELDKRHRQGRPRLWIPIVKMIAWRLVLHFFMSALLISLKIFQALIVGWISNFFTSEGSYEDVRNAYLYALALLVTGFILPLVHAHSFLIGQEMGMIARIALTGAIYKKTLELKLKTIGETTIGKIVNLASNDVQRMDISFMFTSYLIWGPLNVLMVGALLWVYVDVGPSSAAGIGLMVLQLPIQLLLGYLYSKFRTASAKQTDERVKVMNEIISGIRVIKMYGWENAFKKLITKIRRKESILITMAAMARAVTGAFLAVSPGLVTLLMFSTFVLTTGRPLSPAIVFTTIALVSNLRFTSVMLVLRGILGLQEAAVAFKRIQALLLMDLPDATSKRRYTRRPTITSLLPAEELMNGATGGGQHLHKFDSVPEGETPSICVEGLRASWANQAESGKPTLNNLAFECGVNNRMLAIVGPVGAGKSSILSCLLGELEPRAGSIDIVGSLGYAAQEPWVFSGSIRENIVFGQDFQEQWYREVLESCCLHEDVKELPGGDLTVVGERGVTLSGGQKARVTLARAVYRKADVYVLDDPLSAVDTVVGRRLFQTCMSGVLRNSVIVLVTHHLQYAQLADNMLVIDQGEPLAYGTYDEIMAMIDQSEENPLYSRMKAVLSEMIASMKYQENKNVFDVIDSSENLTSGFEEDSESITEQLPTLGEGATLPLVVDRKVGAPVKETLDSPKENGSYSSPGMLDASLALHESSSLANFPSTWDVNEELEKTGDIREEQKGKNEEKKDILKVHTGVVIPKEDMASGSVTLKTYAAYFVSGAGYIGSFLLLVVFVLTEVNIVVSDWWLSEWAESNSSCRFENSTNLLCNFTDETIIGIYSGIVGSSTLLSAIRSITFFYICTRASRVLHNKMFGAVLRAPVRFFDVNPIGRILNRFSKDLAFLDDLLPFYFADFLFILLRFTSIMIIAGVANPYVFIPVVVVVVMFLLLRWYFLRTGRDVKRLEAISRSPLYSHLSTTLQGLTTIRACERQEAFEAYFHAYQNEQSKGWSEFLMASRWFGVRIDTLSGIFVGIVAFSSIPLAGEVDVGLIGLSLAYSVSLAGMFQYGVRMSTEVENLMISAERLMAYGRLQSEAPLETPPSVASPPQDWPARGAVAVHHLKFRHSLECPYVLKGINFDILPQEKVGIVGRTGAGKSSLLQALFRMAEPEGVLEIDGLSITELGLHDLRQRISIIPQDPVLFSGSVRYNLDPFGQHSDQDVWTALEQVQLKSVIEEMSNQLNASVSEAGSNFSVGQRQLLCLGRALLRRNKILVIDEATANVDTMTDAIIQQTIRRAFSTCTTLTIAHRLNTIMDANRVMVLSAGTVKEFDVPHLLLLDPHSLLSRMVDQTSPNEREHLRTIAREAYLERTPKAINT